MKENNNLSRVARNSKKEKTTIEPKTEEINIEPKKKSPLKKILLLIFIIGLLILLWARFIGTMGLIVKEYGITSSKLPDSFDGLKVVQISDIHYGTIINQKRLENIVNEINKIKNIEGFINTADKLVNYKEIYKINGLNIFFF